jgi:tRNA 2-thiouridine synthesizing protein A
MALPTADRTEDARGLKCPFPVLTTNRALRQMEAGMVLKILFTDPTARRDLPSYCQDQGHQILACHAEGEAFAMLIQKGHR